MKCPACQVAFVEGDFTTLVPLGPGDSQEAQERARTDRAYNAVALEVHWSCGTGRSDEEAEAILVAMMATQPED